MKRIYFVFPVVVVPVFPQPPSAIIKKGKGSHEKKRKTKLVRINMILVIGLKVMNYLFQR